MVPSQDEQPETAVELIQEEVHGVHCRSPEETPEFLRASLSRLAVILNSNELIPERDKKAYLASQESSTYVNTDDFRLRFLRAELFDVPKAARTMTRFLNIVEVVFGPYALKRPIQLDDFDKDELKILRIGLIQFLPFRDRSGRRILVIFLSIAFRTILDDLRIKIYLYFCYSAGTNDVYTQRKGIVIVIWAQGCNGGLHFRETNFVRMTPDFVKDLQRMRPLRASAIHLCSPDTPLFRLVRNVFSIALQETTSFGSDATGGSKIRIHFGDSIELKYALQSYGIFADKIPVTLSSIIKLSYLNQWLWIRQYIEQGLSIVECPGIYDVVIRQGTAAMYHPGNLWFYDLIQSKFEDHIELLLPKQEQKVRSITLSIIIDFFKLTPILLESFVSDLMQAIRESSGRILIWFDNKGYGCVGWWTVLDDPEQRHSKIEYMVMREYKKVIKSVTRERRNNKRKERARRKEAEPAPGSGSAPPEELQDLRSDTSIFRSQDGKTGINDRDGCGGSFSRCNLPDPMNIDSEGSG